MKIAWLSFDFIEYSVPHVNEISAEHEILALLPKNQMRDFEKQLSPSVDFRGFYKPRFRQPLAQTKMIHAILRELKQFSPDVIHFQQGHLYFNWVLPWLKEYPLVLTIHNPRHHPGDKDSRKTPQWIMDFGFRRANRIIVHGSELPEEVHREIGIPKDKIHVIPHIAFGLPADESKPSSKPPPVNDSSKEKLPGTPSGSKNDENHASKSEEQELRILFFGRIWEYKGLEYLIRAQPIVCQRFPQAKIVIGGRGDDFDKYRAIMTDPERFEIHNDWIDDELRARLFAQADVVILPYIEATQSGVVPIAYAHRKPVIATRVGGLPDVVEHGRTGLLVAPRDVQQLASAIIELLGDSERRRKMGLAGREKLEQECGPDVVARQTVAVYQHAIQDRQERLCAALSE